MKEFNLYSMQKKGASGVKALIGVVVLLILIAYLAPTVLVGLFNTSAFSYIGGNESLGLTGVPIWVPTVLGILGVVAFVYIMLDAANKK